MEADEWVGGGVHAGCEVSIELLYARLAFRCHGHLSGEIGSGGGGGGGGVVS